MAVAAPASVPTLAECERIIMETPGGICETQYEQLPWHTGAKLWMKTFKNCYSNMREYWEDVVRKHSAREYMVYEDPYSKVEERITYGETAARVRQLANAMSKEFGVTKGDRVVLAMRNYTGED
jgi:long-chain acyl-CoA synthetase